MPGYSEGTERSPVREGRCVAWLAAWLVAVALAGCASGPQREPAPAGKPGGYYLDDGPHAEPPRDLDRVPDAEPRDEAIKTSTTRPYSVMGRTYVPMTQHAPYSATGLASWYGKRYHGKQTASGEPYDMYAMTAAHPTLPIPSYARVTHVENARSVVVRVNDRGPFHSGRLIDLSYTAAYKLGMLAEGSAPVRVDAILPGGEATSPGQREAAGDPAAIAPVQEPARVDASATPRPGLHLQLGAFGLRENAESFLRRLAAELRWLAGLASIQQGDGVFRVQAGPYASRDDALRDAQRIERVLDLRPLLVTR